MMERYYRFAGMEFQISADSSAMYRKEYRLEAFSVTSVKEPHRFVFEKKDKLDAPEGVLVKMDPGRQCYKAHDCCIEYQSVLDPSWENAYFRAEHRGKNHYVQLRSKMNPQGLTVRTMMESMNLPHLSLQVQCVLFHCSYISYKGKAILFTAPSETGKSTQAELWHIYRDTDIINGDRAAVRIADGNVIAEGVPFSGSSPYCENRSLPLKAIVYLGQAPKTSIRKLRGYEAFSRIWEGISVNTWDRTDLEVASDIVKHIVETVPVYHMPCTPDEDAVIVLEKELRKLVSV